MDNRNNSAPAPAEKEREAYCPICRKILPVLPGQPIPRCCGKPMQILN